ARGRPLDPVPETTVAARWRRQPWRQARALGARRRERRGRLLLPGDPRDPVPGDGELAAESLEGPVRDAALDLVAVIDAGRVPFAVGPSRDAGLIAAVAGLVRLEGRRRRRVVAAALIPGIDELSHGRVGGVRRVAREIDKRFEGAAARPEGKGRGGRR